MNKEEIKKAKRRRRYVRAAIQLLYFIFFPSVFTAAFSGVKYVFIRMGVGEALEWTSFVVILVSLCAFTFLFGRFFCGYACAFGSLGDGVHALCGAALKRLGKKPWKIPEPWAKKLTYVKYMAVCAVALLCFLEVWPSVQRISPWDVFSMLRAGNFHIGGYIPGACVFIVLLAGMCVQERFFCRFFCPMGAVFALLPVLPAFTLYRDRQNCIPGCSGCTRQCPSDLGLPEQGSMAASGDCFLCQKCTDVCPRENIHCGIRRLRGNECWFTLLRAGALLALFIWLGVGR